MKNKVSVLLLFFFSSGFLTLNAQTPRTTSIPVAATKHFAKHFPKATDIKWKPVGTNYTAEFEIGKTDYKANYDNRGKFLSSVKELTKSQYPMVVKEAIARDFPKYKIDDLDEINTNGVLTYKAELDGAPDLNVWYSALGKLLKMKSRQ